MEKKLKFSLSNTEWAVVTLFTGALLFFICLSHITENAPLNPINPQSIQVTVSGEVEYPGSHTLPAGSTVADLNAVVFPFAGATPKKRASYSLLKEGEHILFEDTRIKVTVRGAVTQAVTLKVPRGSYLQDHLDEIPLSPDADTQDLAGKKATRQGQVIIVRTKSLP